MRKENGGGSKNTERSSHHTCTHEFCLGLIGCVCVFFDNKQMTSNIFLSSGFVWLVGARAMIWSKILWSNYTWGGRITMCLFFLGVCSLSLSLRNNNSNKKKDNLVSYEPPHRPKTASEDWDWDWDWDFCSLCAMPILFGQASGHSLGLRIETKPLK
mmetsp:Transcript_13602/g.32938  ORF Transcript_13602/g.32938 Transcript_13602/m.32938 type:complete len:157 (+) Transcript_13602:168-638(+)